MEWWVIAGVLVTSLMLGVLRRWRRSGRGARNYQPSNPYSRRTVARPTLPALDPDRTAHDGTCRRCRVSAPVLLAHCRLEWRPWRLEWQCQVCGADGVTRVAADALPLLLALDRAGGMPLSQREVARFGRAGAAEVEQALIDEVLP